MAPVGGVRGDVAEVGGRVHLVADDAAHRVDRVLRDRLLERKVNNQIVLMGNVMRCNM